MIIIAHASPEQFVLGLLVGAVLALAHVTLKWIRK